MKYLDFVGADGLPAPEELAVNRRSSSRPLTRPPGTTRSRCARSRTDDPPAVQPRPAADLHLMSPDAAEPVGPGTAGWPRPTPDAP